MESMYRAPHSPTQEIPVAQYISDYGIEQTMVQDTLYAFPELCYLLGSVHQDAITTDTRPDGIEREVYPLTLGSGMFGLTNPKDALRWKGIFHHVMGTARQVYWLSERLMHISDGQQALFGRFGFDETSFSSIYPETLRNFMFISHAGRRRADEYLWHGLHDTGPESHDPGSRTVQVLVEQNADPYYIDLMRVELHADYLADASKSRFPDLTDNLLTYPDWTFGQKPITLNERFTGLRNARRAPVEVLSVLERCGITFESVLQYTVDPHIVTDMTHAGPYEWETSIRTAYATSAGLTLTEVFPQYQKA